MEKYYRTSMFIILTYFCASCINDSNKLKIENVKLIKLKDSLISLSSKNKIISKQDEIIGVLIKDMSRGLNINTNKDNISVEFKSKYTADLIYKGLVDSFVIYQYSNTNVYSNSYIFFDIKNNINIFIQYKENFKINNANNKEDTLIVIYFLDEYLKPFGSIKIRTDSIYVIESYKDSYYKDFALYAQNVLIDSLPVKISEFEYTDIIIVYNRLKMKDYDIKQTVFYNYGYVFKDMPLWVEYANCLPFTQTDINR